MNLPLRIVIKVHLGYFRLLKRKWRLIVLRLPIVSQTTNQKKVKEREKTLAHILIYNGFWTIYMRWGCSVCFWYL